MPAWLVNRLEDLRMQHAELEAAQRDTRLASEDGQVFQQVRAPAVLSAPARGGRVRAIVRPNSVQHRSEPNFLSVYERASGATKPHLFRVNNTLLSAAVGLLLWCETVSTGVPRVSQSGA